jgi:CelD/BcsL family acetyltransferase involved in cellulose biosynthesis
VEQAFTGTGQNFVLEFRDGPALLGLAPLLSRRRLALPTLGLAGMGATTGYGLADYGGLLAAPGQEAQVAARMASWLERNSGWQMADFQQLPAGPGPIHLLASLKAAGLSTVVQRQNLCYRIPLPGSWEAYRLRLSANAREWLERKPRKFAREWGSPVHEVPAGEVLVEYWALRAFVVDRFGVKRDGLEDQRLTALMTAWLPLALDRGYLRMFRMKANGRTVGVLLGYAFEQTYYFHAMGFDPDPRYRAYSLGACLLSAAIHWSIDHGVGCFDLMRGDHPYKERLGGVPRTNFRILAFRSASLAFIAKTALRLRGAAISDILSSLVEEP